MKLYPRRSDISALTYAVVGWTSAIVFIFLGFEPLLRGKPLGAGPSTIEGLLAWTLVVVFFGGSIVGGGKGAAGLARRHHLLENAVAFLMSLGAAWFVLLVAGLNVM